MSEAWEITAGEGYTSEDRRRARRLHAVGHRREIYDTEAGRSSRRAASQLSSSSPSRSGRRIEATLEDRTDAAAVRAPS